MRGLEYYTGPVFEAELLREFHDADGNPIRFGSVGGGGRYDGLVARFRGEAVPATGFSVGISRLAAAMAASEGQAADGPVLVLVLDQAEIADYAAMTAELRNAGVRAEMYLGSSGMRAQMKYADRRGSPAVVIVGGDERAKGIVTIKDLKAGAEAAKGVADNEAWRSERPGQFEAPRGELVPRIRGHRRGRPMSGAPAKPDAALAKIAAVSGALIDPPTLLPARTILELSGEAVRSRLCTFTDAMGEEFCLRPDMTAPIAGQVAVGRIPVQRYHYSGSAYRLAAPGSDDAIEFAQIGFEWFGGGGVEEDAEALALALEAAKAGGAREVSLRVGDVALFRAVVDALGFSPRWTERLKRSFARRAGPKELLEQSADGLDAPSPLAAGLAALPAEDARRAVEEIFAITGVQPVGGRDAAEIAERLCDRAAERAPDAGAAAKLIAYLDIETPAGEAVAKLRTFAKEAGADVGAALEAFAARLDRIDAVKPPFWKSANFSAEAGRRFEYYDGFVFDLGHTGSTDRPIGGGGRYDGLIGRLSGNARSSGAIGAALRVDRLGAGRP